MVLVCYPHRFIYLKTHKTAGTSVEMAFEPFCCAPGTTIVLGTPARRSDQGIVGARDGDGRMWRQEEPLWQGHMTAKELRANLRLDRWWRAFKFASVRNPFDRAVSQFLFRWSRSDKPPLTSIDTLRAEFRDFLTGGGFKSDRGIVFVWKRCVLDDVIRYENLAAEIQRVATRLKLPADGLVLPHARDNTSARLGHAVADFYAPDLIDIVRRTDEWVFPLGGYSESPP